MYFCCHSFVRRYWLIRSLRPFSVETMSRARRRFKLRQVFRLVAWTSLRAKLLLCSLSFSVSVSLVFVLCLRFTTFLIKIMFAGALRTLCHLPLSIRNGTNETDEKKNKRKMTFHAATYGVDVHDFGVRLRLKNISKNQLSRNRPHRKGHATMTTTTWSHCVNISDGRHRRWKHSIALVVTATAASKPQFHRIRFSSDDNDEQ